MKSTFQVFPRCNNPEGIVDNILMVFDPENSGIVSFRELLILFSMSMDGTPREKLHWAFRLYDQVKPLKSLKYQPGVNFTKLFSPSEKLSVHSIWQKFHCSISTTINSPRKLTISPDLMLKFLQNLPNLCSVCQTLFASILFARKSRANMLVKLTPGETLSNIK